MKTLVIVYSYHHNNTAKIAQVMADVLDAEVVTPGQVNIGELKQYDLIGFGAGIDSAKHYKPPLLELAEKLPKFENKKSFIFSTSAIQGENKVRKDHEALRESLNSKGFKILDEFSCKGFNTNSFLKFFGGMNKGRPNEDDLNHARRFSSGIIEKFKD